jgi:hypothetical protein
VSSSVETNANATTQVIPPVVLLAADPEAFRMESPPNSRTPGMVWNFTKIDSDLAIRITEDEPQLAYVYLAFRDLPVADISYPALLSFITRFCKHFNMSSELIIYGSISASRPLATRVPILTAERPADRRLIVTVVGKEIADYRDTWSTLLHEIGIRPRKLAVPNPYADLATVLAAGFWHDGDPVCLGNLTQVPGHSGYAFETHSATGAQ